jgi:putative protein kinase ArgK-like GTPase of G3E family
MTSYVYRLLDNDHNVLYVGSTSLKAYKRLSIHKQNARQMNLKPISQKIRELNFEVNISASDQKYSKLDARIEEQKVIESYGIENLCNKIASYREDSEYHRNHGDNESHRKKLASRKRHYQKKKTDVNWFEAERERGKIRAANKRAQESDAQKCERKEKDRLRARYKRECIILRNITID